MIRLSLDYSTFDPVSKESLTEAMFRMIGIGKELKTREKRNRALLIEAFGQLAKSVFMVATIGGLP